MSTEPVPPPPAPGFRRQYINNPCTIAECGGPCVGGGPEACTCGVLWHDVPATWASEHMAHHAWSLVLVSLDERITELQRQRDAHSAQREEWMRRFIIRQAIGESGAPPDPA